jgi:hypothetical protein
MGVSTSSCLSCLHHSKSVRCLTSGLPYSCTCRCDAYSVLAHDTYVCVQVVLNAASLCSELLGAPQARASYTNMAGGGWAEGEEELGLEFAHFVATSLDFLEGLSLVGEKEDSEGSMFASQMGRKKNDVDSNGAWVKVMELGYRLHEVPFRIHIACTKMHASTDESVHTQAKKSAHGWRCVQPLCRLREGAYRI